VVASSNRNIEECVERKEFRRDLYYRINVLRLRLPPLRERRKDIRLLAERFLETVAGAGRAFTAAALEFLAAQEWPGNVRQLLNVVQQATVFSSGARIDVGDLPGIPLAAPIPPAATFREAKQRTVREFERAYVLASLEKHRGNVTRAAQEAGKDRRAFGRLVKKYRQKLSSAVG